MKKSLVLLILILMMTSCTSPLDKKVSSDLTEKDMKILEKELSEEDFEILISNIIRLKKMDAYVGDMTWRELVKNGREWKAEQKSIDSQ